VLHRIFAAFFTFLILTTSHLFADTVRLTSGNEMKGLVVDEYVDRIVVNTFEGEKTVLRKDIKDIQYENEETRLLKLGDEATARGKYKNAIYYYQAVLKLDPDSVAARDGEIAAIRKQLGSGTEKAKEEIDLMIALEETTAKASGGRIDTYEKNVQNLLGLKLKKDEENNTCYIEEVMPNSVSADYDIRKKDVISAVWNDNVKYMSYEGIINKLSGPEFSMIKLSLERKVDFPEPKRLKWDIGIKEEGYFIKEASGLNASEKGLFIPGDWVLEINSVSTRYMPKAEFNRLLSDNNAPLTLLIKRDLYMTREKRR